MYERREGRGVYERRVGRGVCEGVCVREKGRGGGRRGCVRGRGGGRRGVNKEIEGTGEEHYSTYRLLHSRKLSRMQKFETVSKDFFGSHPYTAREASPEKDFPCEIFSLRNLSVQFAKVCILRRFTTIRQTQPSLPAPPTSSTYQLHPPAPPTWHLPESQSLPCYSQYWSSSAQCFPGDR